MLQTITYLNTAANQLRDLVAQLHAPVYEILADEVAVEDEECEYCGGEGEVCSDEYDEDSHQYMRGVGRMTCICQY